MPDLQTEVLVVGSGPVGLTAALELRRRGIDVVIVDRLTEPPQYAKAVGIQPRTLELWDAAGVIRPALDACTSLRGQLLYRDGELVNQLDLALPDDVFYQFVAIPQYETERVLTEALSEYGTRVQRGVEFRTAEDDGDRVTATLADPDGRSWQVEAQYLVGCDGAHSAVRKLLGVGFAGDAFAEQYMLGDVEVDWDLPEGYGIRASRAAEGGPDDLMVCIPLPGRRRYRISSLVDPELAGGTDGSDRAGDRIAHGFESGRQPELRHIQRVLDRLAPQPTTASALRWSSVFRISHRLADRYSAGRMFLAGDAAHIHPPTGAQGANTGMQDAINLAWKLALAVRGRAADGLLDSYHEERHPVGVEVVGRTVGHARSGFDPPATGLQAMLAREAQLLVGYPDSRFVGQEDGDRFAGGAQPGQRAPDAAGLRQSTVRDPIRLHELFRHPGHTVLFWSADGDIPAEALAAADVTGVRAYVLAPHLALPAGLAVEDSAGTVAAAYGVAGLRQAVHVIRPDGYVGFRGTDVSPAAVGRGQRTAGLSESVPRG
jgi:2-polyprenyl-6-methoxyphenol hydroxylase-like FAD-dependent oxidoreductase